jgi:hypothetical protein
MRTNDPAKLGHGVRKPNANTSSHCAFECSDPFGPDDWVSRSSTRDCDDESQILDHRVGDSHQDDVADDYRALDC